MKQVALLVESFKSDPEYAHYSFWNNASDGMWNFYPKADVFIGDDRAAVVLQGPVQPRGNFFVDFKVFYPELFSPSGRPWSALLYHLSTSAGLSRHLGIDAGALANLLLSPTDGAPDSMPPPDSDIL